MIKNVEYFFRQNASDIITIKPLLVFDPTPLIVVIVWSFHTLRHTYTTNLANADVPVKQLSDRLGHSSTTTTMDKYSKANREAIEPYLIQINVKDV